MTITRFALNKKINEIIHGLSLGQLLPHEIAVKMAVQLSKDAIAAKLPEEILELMQFFKDAVLEIFDKIPNREVVSVITQYEVYLVPNNPWEQLRKIQEKIKCS